MSSRSIKTAKGQSPLDSLPPDMRAEAEARAAARAAATPNEAIKVSPAPAPLGDAKTDYMRQIGNRHQAIKDQTQ